MNTRQKMMGLAALPLAGLLAVGGVALAQAAGPPAGTQVVQQAVTHQAGVPSPVHPAQPAAEPTQQRLQTRDRDGTCDDQLQTQTADRQMDQLRDGSCLDQVDQ